MTATAEQQGPAQGVSRLVRDLSPQDEVFELLAVLMELFLIELVLQELRDNFCFSNAP
jgi:hypothetical protein